MSLLEKAISIAVEKHMGQKDKSGQPYILHPFRVMLRLDTEDEMIAGVLHDVIEDSDMTLEDLKEQGFPQNIIDAVDAVSRRGGESYEEFFNRTMDNPLAVKVKKADLEDNMDVTRLEDVKPEDIKRLNKYLTHWRKIIEL